MESIALASVVAYALVINVATYVAYATDKRRAERGEWRIRERTLLLLAFFGGALGAHVAMRLRRHKTQKRKFAWTVPVLMAVQMAALALFLALNAYASTYYRATDSALAALESDAAVTVSETAGGYFFDGPGTDDVLAFYPGGLVDERAYAPLLRRVAAGGVDCALVRAPYHLAIFGVNRADAVTRSGDYGHRYVGGHSLGGAVAGAYAHDHADELDGIVLLGSYVDKDLGSTGLAALSVRGTNDEVLSMDGYEEARALLPADAEELVIEGGNHAQFGDYGAQRGDGEPTVSAEEQQRQAADAILAMVLGRD